MAIIRNNSHKGRITISSEDLTTDNINNNVEFEGSNGEKLLVDMWMYVRYFFKEIQKKDINNGYVYVDGCITPIIMCRKYLHDKDEEKIIAKMTHLEEFMLDSTCYDFQQNISCKYNVHINWVALYYLCLYVNEIINRRYCLILKPSINETREELGGLDEIDKITITRKDGRKITTSYSAVKDNFVKSISDCNDEMRGIDKMVKKVDVYTKEYGQTEFIKYMSRFFHDYFPIKRRKNGYISIEEQELIRYLLKFFKYSPEIISDSRFRQLFRAKYNCPEHLFFLNFPGFFESNLALGIEFLTYSDIKSGKINPLNLKLIEKIEVKHFQYRIEGNLSYITEIINLAKDMIDNKETSWDYVKNNE